MFEGWQLPPSSTRIGTPNPSTELDVLLALSLQDADLPELVQSVSEPDTPDYRHYETVSWLADHSGANVTTIDDVLDYLRSQGTAGHLDPTASYVEAALTVRQAAKLFGVRYGTYRVTSRGTMTLAAPESEPYLPRPLVGSVTLVLGTADVLSAAPVQPAPFRKTPSARSLLGPTFGTMGTPGGCPAGNHVARGTTSMFTPRQYLSAYGVESLQDEGVSGDGQTVAIWSGVPGRQSDLATFTHCFGLSTPQIHNVPIGLGTRASLKFALAHDEESLDTEMVAAMAPRLSGIDVMNTPDETTAVGITELLDAPLDRSLFHGPMPKIVSISLGFCEAGGTFSYRQYPLAYALDEHLLMDAAATGISTVNSSGDTGSSCNLATPARPSGARLSVQYPSSSPFVTDAGGALLGLNADDSIRSEAAWDDLPLGFGLASGGGESTVFARPWYQAALAVSGADRLVPDVALEADSFYPISTYCSLGCTSSGWQPGGGTSAAAPLLAGGMALANEEAAGQHEGSLGLLNPLLYQLGQEHSSALVDITNGSNDVYGLGCCTALPGYDEATGWGSVNFPQFIQAADEAAR